MGKIISKVKNEILESIKIYKVTDFTIIAESRLLKRGLFNYICCKSVILF